MKKYRSRKIVEACRWFKDGDHPKVKMMNGRSHCIYCGEIEDAHGYIKNKYGNNETVCPGMWVVTDKNGNLEKYDPVTFEKMFELL
jgi:hypothetical protein